MSDTGLCREQFPPSVAQSIYSVPIDPGFLNQCCIHLPYCKFSIKKGHCSLAMVQIYLDTLYPSDMDRLGPIVCCGRFCALLVLSPHYHSDLPQLSFLLAAMDNLDLVNCRPNTSTGLLLLALSVGMPDRLAYWTVFFFALLKSATFGMSLPSIFCILSLILLEMSAPWGGLSALLSSTVHVCLYSSDPVLKGSFFTRCLHMCPHMLGK